MPDEDRFERVLRGRGWRKVYRLATGNAPIPMTVDAAISAAAHALRNELRCERIGEIVDIIRRAARARDPSRAVSFTEPAAACDASAELDEIGESAIGCHATRLAVRAAREAILALNRSGPSDDIEATFGHRFVSGLVENQCIGRVRSGIIEKTGRTLEAQAEWEKSLFEAIKPQARLLLKNAVASHDAGRIRAPKRLVPRMPTTLEQLQRPIVQPQGE